MANLKFKEFNLNEKPEELSLAKNELLKRITSSNLSPIILCGSLISSYSPTNIPNGKAMTTALFTFLFNQFREPTGPLSETDMKVIEHIYSGDDEFIGLPFEVLFEDCGKLELIKEMLYSYFSGRTYNDIHYALAEQLSYNNIHALITPNYDDCIDQISKVTDILSYQPITCEEQATQLNNQSHACFYVHGSVSNNHPKQLIVSMSDEKTLPLWKKELLIELIKDRYLIIIGYSGRDFEICPIINELLKDGICKGIITNNYDNKYSYNIVNMLQCISKSSEYENLSIVSDILVFLKLLFNVDINVKRFSDTKEFIDQINFVFPNNKEKAFWALRLLVHMGCVKQACTVIKHLEDEYELTDSDAKFLKISKAAALYKSGEYLNSAHLYKEARKIKLCIADKTSGMYADLALMSDMFESYRAGYYLVRASICALKMFAILRKCQDISKEFDLSAQATVHYRKTMLIKNISMLFNLKIPFVMNKIFNMYKKGIEQAEQCGSRVLMQNFALEIMSIQSLINRKAFNSFCNGIEPSTLFAVKQTAAGYGEMASFFEYAIFCRREIMNKNKIKLFNKNKKIRLDVYSQNKLNELVSYCVDCGILPEAYKSLYLLSKANAICSSTKNFNWKLLFAQCQYSSLYKLRVEIF